MRSPVPSPSSMTVLAFAIVIVPFAIILARLALAPGGHFYLTDDLALIDLHTREALRWKQQLGVFDRNGWNHPGPTYFYLLSLSYRVFGSGVKAMFVGATLINTLAAVACVGVVRRRSTPARALWAALWVCVLASLLAAVGAGSVAYSEGALGGLVSPWNPMVVIFPLLLFILLTAGAMDRSPLSLIAALLVGSFIVQTDFSTLPLIAVLLAGAFVAWAAIAVVARSRNRGDASGGSGRPRSSDRLSLFTRFTEPTRARAWTGVGLLVFVLMWLPPVIQQMTNHPGNLTLIYRYFTAGYPGQATTTALSAIVAVTGILVEGPSEVMHASLAHTPHHFVAALTVTGIVLLICAVSTIVAFRQRSRFAAGLETLCLVGFLVMIGAVSKLVGHPYGYLVVWAVALPVAVLIGAGTLWLPFAVEPARGSVREDRERPIVSISSLRLVACLIGAVAAVVFCVRVSDIPPLSSVSAPQIGRLASLVTPSLDPRKTVFVNDSGAGSNTDSRLIDLEKFIGLVNELDQRGYHPKVNHVWEPEFGPGYVANGTEARSIEMRTWTPKSSQEAGYLGRVGDLAVSLTKSVNGRSTDPADIGLLVSERQSVAANASGVSPTGTSYRSRCRR